MPRHAGSFHPLMFSLRRPSLLLPALLALGLAVGCRRAEVTSYRAPKDAAPAAAAPMAMTAGTPAAPAPTAAAANSAMAATPVPTAGGAELKWTAPTQWVVKPASAMRKATYTIKGDGGAEAELAVTAFPGDVGGEAANLTRWRGQLGLPEASATDMAKAITRFEAGPLKIALADFVNDKTTPPARLLGAIVPAGSDTWFFKLTGPPALLEKEKPAFIEFLKTLKTP
jgi:hypothetical protein